MSAAVHVGDVGTIFIATIVDQTNAVVDVSNATTKQIWFSKPSGQILQGAASFTTSGTDGQLQYTANAGDLNQAGVWTWQAYVIIPSGTFHSELKQFRVDDNIGGKI